VDCYVIKLLRGPPYLTMLKYNKTKTKRVLCSLTLFRESFIGFHQNTLFKYFAGPLIVYFLSSDVHGMPLFKKC